MNNQAIIDGYQIKCITVGDSSVGKTSLSYRFINGKFDPNMELTIGVQYGEKTIQINRTKVKLQIWDTAGQQDFRSLTKSYYRSSAIALVVYDCTRLNTFQNVKRWINQIHDNSASSTILVLVCNKIDLHDKRVVSKNEGSRLAKENNMIYIQTSAKLNSNVQDVFQIPAVRVLDMIQSGMLNIKDCPGIRQMKRNQGSSRQTGRGGCCQC